LVLVVCRVCLRLAVVAGGAGMTTLRYGKSILRHAMLLKALLAAAQNGVPCLHEFDFYKHRAEKGLGVRTSVILVPMEVPCTTRLAVIAGGAGMIDFGFDGPVMHCQHVVDYYLHLRNYPYLSRTERRIAEEMHWAYVQASRSAAFAETMFRYNKCTTR
jgi:hypothetical protein